MSFWIMTVWIDAWHGLIREGLCMGVVGRKGRIQVPYVRSMYSLVQHCYPKPKPKPLSLESVTMASDESLNIS